MKTQLWVMSLIAMLIGCKHEESIPKPNPTEINILVTDEINQPIPNIDIGISASTGSYLGGTRRDTIFATSYSDVTGKTSYKAMIDSKWRVVVSVSGVPLYSLVKFEGTEDGIVNVGRVNNITVIMRKR